MSVIAPDHVIRLATADEMAVSIPYQLGFHPAQSIVVVALHGKRLGGIVRLDIPPGPLAADAARSVYRTLSARGLPDAVLLLGYERVSGEATSALVAFAEEAFGADMSVCDVQAVHDGTISEVVLHRGRRARGRMLASRGPARALPHPSQVPAVADFVALGAVALPSREALEDLLEPGEQPAQVTRVSQVAEELDRLGGRLPGRGSALRAWGRHLRRGVLPGGLPARDIAVMVAVLADREVRDSLLAWLCPGLIPDHLLEEECRRLIHQHVPERSPSAVEGVDDQGAHQELLLALVRATPVAAPGAAADICSVLAQQVWSRGNCALAQIAASRALEHQPEHVLAGLVLQLAEGGVSPESMRAAVAAHVADT